MYTPAASGNSREGLHGLFEACNIISSLKYEGQDGNGQIIVAELGHEYIDTLVQFNKPTSIRNYRAVRKLLELSSDTICLLSDAGHIYGLGTVRNTYDTEREDLFIINFTGHYEWELLHGRHTLMVVTYGLPQLPAQQLEKNKFIDHCLRLFHGISHNQIQNLWSLTLEAANQKHGTMLVISDGASEEATRLASQCTMINPVLLSVEIMKLITNIDGSVLIDRNGICYAIGVILDGLATSKGDPARGSRYNSAVRYLDTTKFPCLIITFSEDGMVNLVPELKPQIERNLIEEKIGILRELRLTGFEVNRKLFNQTMEWLKYHRFYLSAKNCEEINTLRSNIEMQIDSTTIRIVHYDLNPHPEMNDSYFL
jgi:DNA integrity scanning protein DisA with diadenylate cyclase activity